MISFSKNILKFLFNYRPIVIGICLILCALMVSSAFNLKLEEDIMDLLPLEDEAVRGYADVLRAFQKSDRLVFMVQLKSDHPYEAALITAADKLADKLQNSNLIKQVYYKWDAWEVNEALSVLRTFRADLFQQEDAQKLAAFLTPQALDRAIAGWKRLLQETPAPFLSGLLKADPLGMDRLFMQKLEKTRGRNSTTIIEDGRLFSADKRSLLLFAKPNIRSTDSSKGEKLVDETRALIENIERSAMHAVDIAWLGGHRFAVHNAASIKRDITLTVGISLTAITILCLLVFRRRHYFILALLPALFGALTAVAVVSLIKPGISAIVLGMGGALIGIVVDYGIHVLFRADQLEDRQLKKDNIVNMVSSISVPLLLCARTTLAAFLVLIFSSFPGYSQLGWFSVIGIAAAVVFVLFVLPLLITRGGKRTKAILPLTDIFSRYRDAAQKNRKGWMVSSIVITLFALPGLFYLHFDGEVEKLNMVSPDVQKDWDALKYTFPTVMNSAFIVIREQHANNIFEQNEKLHEWIKNSSAGEGIQSVSSLSWLLPSEKMRLQNRERWQVFWSEKRKEELIKNIKIVSKKHGLRPWFFINFIEGLPGPMPEFDVKQLLNQPLLEQILAGQLHIEGERKLLLIRFSLRNTQMLGAFGKRLKEEFPFAFAAVGKEYANKMIQMIFNEFVKLGSLALIVTLGILFVFTRNVLKTVSFFLPLMQAIIFTFGVMGWINMPLNLMAVLVIIFVFGLVVDYSLFLGHSALKSRYEFSQAGGAVTISALTTLFGLGALLFAKHPALHSIGLTGLLGIGSGFLFVMLNYGWLWGKDSPDSSDNLIRNPG